MKLRIEKLGLLAELQDMGRSGYQTYGVPSGGVLDRRAAKIANLLSGNPETHPVIEITLTGPVLSFSSSCQISITGGFMSPKLNDEPIPMYKTVDVDKDSTLSFGKLIKGCRTYLAINGTWETGKWLDSVSPVLHHEIPVLVNNRLAEGAIITIHPGKKIECKTSSLRLEQTTFDLVVAHVTKGPEFHILSSHHKEMLGKVYFSVSKDWNQMGYRLSEYLPGYTPGFEMLSSGIIPGTIQLTRSGQPLVLLSGAQTCGGYPRILQLIKSDMHKIAQMKTGDQIIFKVISLKEALRINEQREEEWEQKRKKFSLI